MKMEGTRKPNRLINEKSPYLLEHAYNPVDWYFWGGEAFAKAKAEDKPIFLSIGYSTCHWCHNMARESFEDPKTAAIMNEKFVSIKVDREERPDLDEIYMKAVTTLTGHGGWPLSVFLTPNLKPFYGGTYFPPVPRHGLPGFPEVLNFIADTWKTKRQEVVQSSEEITKAISDGYVLKQGTLSKVLIDNAYAVVLSAHDSQFGGFGRPPKFPLPSYLGFLLRYHARTGRGSALNPVIKSLDSMADGGIHDHLAGGFHRYSTDRYWLVPHFEKMLYDNALLARVYADAYRVTRMERYASTVRDTLGWILEEMTSPDGGFFSAQDADTPEGEGYYYTWTPAEVSLILGKEDGAILCEYYGVSQDGNFEGRSILNVTTTTEKTAARLGLTAEHVEKALGNARGALLKARRERNRPRVDDKILASWNGLAISGFACAYQALQDERYLSAATRSADFVLGKLVKKGTSPMLSRRYRDGDVAIEGNLEDYSFLIAGLLDLYEASFDKKWMSASIMLTEEMVGLFWDADGGGFFLKPPGGQLVAIKEGYDGPTPSGNSVAALDLLRLSEFTGNRDFREMAETTMKLFADAMESMPTGYLEMLAAVDFSFGSKEVVITNGWGPAGLNAMVREIQTRYLPTKVLALADGDPAMAQLIEGKASIKGMPTVYVCENFACKAPVTEVEALRRQLDAMPGDRGA
jgi:uncharacterized protein YyaL (SSP411 family)